MVGAPSRERAGGFAFVALDGEGHLELLLGEVAFGLGDLERQVLGRRRRARHGDGDRGPQPDAQSCHIPSGSAVRLLVKSATWSRPGDRSRSLEAAVLSQHTAGPGRPGDIARLQGTPRLGPRPAGPTAAR